MGWRVSRGPLKSAQHQGFLALLDRNKAGMSPAVETQNARARRYLRGYEFQLLTLQDGSGQPRGASTKPGPGIQATDLQASV